MNPTRREGAKDRCPSRHSDLDEETRQRAIEALAMAVAREVLQELGCPDGVLPLERRPGATGNGRGAA